jgi:regulatory protein
LKAPLSLKARALQWLAQREHSRLELRRKLLMAVRARVARGSTTAVPFDLDAAHAEVDTLLEWLMAQRYLSDERFADSRVHARATRFGTRRIQQELSQHGLRLSAEQAAALRDSELVRAQVILNRRFGARLGDITTETNGRNPPVEPAEDTSHQHGTWADPASADRARKARFLAARGFSAEVIRRAVRGNADNEIEGG